MEIFLISVAVASLAVLFYVWLTWHFNHWKKRNVPYLEPSLFFGNIKDFVMLKKCKGIVYTELYKQSEEPALGMFSLRTPQWLIRDAELIKILTTNEFSNFRKNDIYTESSDFFMSTNVFFITGDEWKKKRAVITPALTMSKLKHFIPYMVDVTREMIKYLDENQGKAMEAKRFALLYTMETAMSYVYGLKCDSYNNPNSIYRQVILEIFDPNWWNGFKFALATICPSIGHLFKIGLTPKNFVDIYTNVVKEAVEYKKKSGEKRNDLLQFLMDASGKDGTPEMSVYDMTGLTMNIAGDASETSSLAINSVIDALIRYPESQVKLREEIQQKIHSLDDITYENINSIPYLDAYFSESLRVLSPAPLLEKLCTGNCEVQFKGKQYNFVKGDKVAFPLYAVHKDPENFPDADQFKPERFIESDTASLRLMPFGNGPRMCLGRKLAYIQMKVFFCALLNFYQLVPKDDKAPPHEFEANSTFLLMVKGGVWFRAKKL